MDSRFRFHVFPSTGTPIYRQLMEQVKFQVASGRLAAGDILPSVRDTAQDLEINPMTVSKAYSLLEREGVLTRDRGMGMRVSARTVRGNVRERKDELKALLRDVVVKAHQLGFMANEVIEQLRPMLEEMEKPNVRG
ncbi:MAG TPA: GntR family transcriptional regulator [Terriglobia bacterium]|nr:GntR family transcriptional regulator [Terriglobia bacterium]